MMHRNDFVVSICPVNGGKAFREYKIEDTPDSCCARTRRINVPFHSEYEIRFKNLKNVRRSVTVSIDGDCIGSWVVQAGSRHTPVEVTLERFMDSDRRFKVLPLNDGGVDDPTNPENGIIELEVYDELPPPKPKTLFKSTNDIRYGRGSRRGGGGGYGGSILRGCSPAKGSSGDASWMAFNCSTTSNELSLDTTLCSASNAATGEGSVSEQTFTKTHWRGNSGPAMMFVFVIHGKGRCQKQTKTGFCHECGVELAENAKFCHSCGTKTHICI